MRFAISWMGYHSHGKDRGANDIQTQWKNAMALSVEKITELVGKNSSIPISQFAVPGTFLYDLFSTRDSQQSDKPIISSMPQRLFAAPGSFLYTKAAREEQRNV